MIGFLVEWAVRSSILIACGAALLWALRTRDASIKLAAWTAMLCCSLAIPFLGGVLPTVSLPVKQVEMPRPVQAPPTVEEAPWFAIQVSPQPAAVANFAAVAVSPVVKPFDWVRAALALYLLISGIMLARVLIGLIVGSRLLRASTRTEIAGIRESNRVGVPVTLGVVRPVIVLPADWREWDRLKLDAVLAHERSHIQRYDPAMQLVSAIHRALLWMSPLSWFLHSRIVRTAEEASDDAAVIATQDRASYAEILLSFMQRGVWTAGVPMARYGRADARINRILDSTALSRGITRRGLAAIVALGSPLAYVAATAQPQSPPQTQAPPQATTQVVQAPAPTASRRSSTGPRFDIADVHAIPYTNRPMYGGVLRDGRYELRRATILDLIKTAYGVDADTVVGGPSWLDWDRFDVIATAPPSTSPQTVRMMLQSLLEDRFGLSVHRDMRPMPAFVLSMGQGKPKLKEAEGSGDPGCQPVPQTIGPGTVLKSEYSCRNMSMEEFARNLRGMPGVSGPYVTDPIVDGTGLKGSWDFDIKWTPQVYLRLAGSDGITLFDAIDKQLGLKLKPKTVPLPVIVVDSASQKPTANASGVASLPPAPEFEVASLRQSPPDMPPPTLELLPGGRVTMRGQFLDFLIRWAWQDEVIVGMPKWIGPFQPAFDLIARASTSANAPPFDAEEARLMTRTLLVDRFKMVTHYEDRPTDAYTLVATKPKLTKADPSIRSECKRAGSRLPGQPEDAPPMGNNLTCRNLTMTQFAEWIRPWTGSPYAALDATGLAGGWDFTLAWGTFGGARGGGAKGGPPPGGRANGVASEPEGGVSLPDAIEKQLGLKLEMHKRPLPVLVIDHMEEKPIEN